MPSPSSSLTNVGLESEPSSSTSKKLAANANNSSRESFDLALDIDIEKRLYPDTKEETPETTKLGPITLAHDDPDSKYFFYFSVNKYLFIYFFCRLNVFYLS